MKNKTVTAKLPKETFHKTTHTHKKRKGVHAKTKTSKLKGSKNYKKLSRGQ